MKLHSLTAHAVQIVDEYMEKYPGFNPASLLRRKWQGGIAGPQHRFWMRSPMFLRFPENEPKPVPPRNVHRWVQIAHEKSHLYIANPACPAVRSIEAGRLKHISKCSPTFLEYGDVVTVTFMMTYVEGRFDWYPQYHIVDVVRVRHSVFHTSAVSARMTAPSIDTSIRAALSDGEIIDGDCAYFVFLFMSVANIISAEGAGLSGALGEVESQGQTSLPSGSAADRPVDVDVGPSAAAGPEVGMAMSVVNTATIDRISTDAITPREDAPMDRQDSEDGRDMDVSPDTFDSSQDREESVGPVAGRKVADEDSLMSDGSDLTDIENDFQSVAPFAYQIIWITSSSSTLCIREAQGYARKM